MFAFLLLQLSSVDKRRLLHPVAVARNLDRSSQLPRTLEPLEGRSVGGANQAWGANDVSPRKLEDADESGAYDIGILAPSFTSPRNVYL